MKGILLNSTIAFIEADFMTSKQADKLDKRDLPSSLLDDLSAGFVEQIFKLNGIPKEKWDSINDEFTTFYKLNNSLELDLFVKGTLEILIKHTSLIDPERVTVIK